MFRHELDMLEFRLSALEHDLRIQHVLVESPVTHRGVEKPLVFAENKKKFSKWLPRITHVIAEPLIGKPWAVEHAQRNAAWPHVNRNGAADDVVLICDADEIPSEAMLSWWGEQATAVRMRTFIFAVDWEALGPTPPTCVMATAGYLRQQARFGAGLAEVRDSRHLFPELPGGGWHFSWLGGPERQRDKLLTATCHTELIGTPEGDAIASGELYRTGGSVLTPLTAVDVDETWPEYIWKRRCPANWFRPR
jgi:beta-1,4-mannosyl-glycoprotein beta-1,4-N-acetylglucosaminyltransferase